MLKEGRNDCLLSLSVLTLWHLLAGGAGSQAIVRRLACSMHTHRHRVQLAGQAARDLQRSKKQSCHAQWPFHCVSLGLLLLHKG